MKIFLLKTIAAAVCLGSSIGYQSQIESFESSNGFSTPIVSLTEGWHWGFSSSSASRQCDSACRAKLAEEERLKEIERIKKSDELEKIPVSGRRPPSYGYRDGRDKERDNNDYRDEDNRGYPGYRPDGEAELERLKRERIEKCKARNEKGRGDCITKRRDDIDLKEKKCILAFGGGGGIVGIVNRSKRGGVAGAIITVAGTFVCLEDAAKLRREVGNYCQKSIDNKNSRCS